MVAINKTAPSTEPAMAPMVIPPLCSEASEVAVALADEVAVDDGVPVAVTEGEEPSIQD